MATYMYICDKCKNGDSISQTMMEDTPKTIKCEKCGADMRRDIVGEQKTTAIHIPEHMTAAESNKQQFTYNKSPSRKKHFW